MTTITTESYHAHSHPMTGEQRQAAGELIAGLHRRGSVGNFAGKHIVLGAVTLLVGLGVLLYVARQPVASTANTVVAVSAGLCAIVGIGLLGYGVVRMLLGQLIAGRSKDQLQQTIALLDAELQGNTAESITLRLDALAPVDLPAHHRFWIARAGPHYFGLDASDLFPQDTNNPIPRQTLHLTVLPTSRRVVQLQWDGPPVPVTNRPLPEADIPDFARGYRPLRQDHFPDNLHALLP
ncbi:MAG: hypothetical protein MUE97_00165 [Phycisphaerales bacterium]|jgi:hypothetical protein|nr:hypothetical protein [Phycisphaerales bacterium]